MHRRAGVPSACGSGKLASVYRKPRPPSQSKHVNTRFVLGKDGAVSSSPSTPSAGDLASDATLAPSIKATKRKGIRRATFVQHGHTPAEQVVYDQLCALAGPYRDESRVVSAGYAKLAQITRLARKTIARCVASLIRKYSIEVMAPWKAATSTATSYRIPPFAEVQQKRDCAGLTHIDRRGHFVPSSALPAVASTASRGPLATTRPRYRSAEDGPSVRIADTNTKIRGVVTGLPEASSQPAYETEIAPRLQQGTADTPVAALLAMIETGRNGNSAASGAPQPGEEIFEYLRSAIHGYVVTDHEGRSRSFPPDWCNHPPDDQIVRQVGAIFRWKAETAYAVLKELKRAGQHPDKSYGWFVSIFSRQGRV